jgi:hypothetical protein
MPCGQRLVLASRSTRICESALALLGELIWKDGMLIMLKPIDYRETYVDSQGLPAIQLPTEGNLHRQGTLHIGALQITRPTTASDARAFTSAEGVGLVRINSRWLNRMR